MLNGFSLSFIIRKTAIETLAQEMNGGLRNELGAQRAKHKTVPSPWKLYFLNPC